MPKTFSSDLLGGLSATLVAFPSSIAFGLLIFAPLGTSYLAAGAFAGIFGGVIIGLIAPILGGAPRLVSAPCAPAAAVLAALAVDLFHSSPLQHSPELILLALGLVGLSAGLLQSLFGVLGGGTVIKFIPYPVVAGYLSGVGCIIILGQLNVLLGAPKSLGAFTAITSMASWKIPALLVGAVSLCVMFIAPKMTPKIPAPIIALLAGVATYFAMSGFFPELQGLSNNPFVIGPHASVWETPLIATAVEKWQNLAHFPLEALSYLLLPTLTLAVLLSIDTLKTCVILDALTKSRHRSNRELFGQGIANLASNLLGGMSGAGTMGATLVNVSAGGQTRFSGFWVGVFSLVACLFLSNLLAWVPLSALSGILIAVGIRMIDLNTFHLLKQRATWLDFLVVASVVTTAITVNLMAASGLGVLLAILLFLREQIRGSVVRRKSFGNTHFSKKRRLPYEIQALEDAGHAIAVFELQGALFFGTTDQLFTEVEPALKTSHVIVLDMRHVHSVDFTAAHMLKHIEALVKDKHGMLFYCSLNTPLYSGQTLEAYLKYFDVLQEIPHSNHFNDLNDALERAEEIILKEQLPEREHAPSRALELAEFNLFKDIPAAIQNEIKQYLRPQRYEPGAVIFEQGDAGAALYLIRSGEVKIMLPMGANQYYHITTFGMGDFFGDIAFLDQQTRSARALAATPVELFILTRMDFDKAVSVYPDFSGQFFAQIAYVLGIRLRHADAELRALEGA